MIQCPTCGVVIHSSDTPENVLKNHNAEQHPAIKPVPTFKEGFDFAVELVRDEIEAPKVADQLKALYKEPD